MRALVRSLAAPYWHATLLTVPRTICACSGSRKMELFLLFLIFFFSSSCLKMQENFGLVTRTKQAHKQGMTNHLI